MWKKLTAAMLGGYLIVGTACQVQAAALQSVGIGNANIQCSDGTNPGIPHSWTWKNTTGHSIYITQECDWSGMDNGEDADFWRSVTVPGAWLHGSEGMDHYMPYVAAEPNGTVSGLGAGNETEPQYRCTSWEPDSIELPAGKSLVASAACIDWYMPEPIPSYKSQAGFLVYFWYRSNP